MLQGSIIQCNVVTAEKFISKIKASVYITNLVVTNHSMQCNYSREIDSDCYAPPILFLFSNYLTKDPLQRNCSAVTTFQINSTLRVKTWDFGVLL
jgi:hypothetical protein